MQDRLSNLEQLVSEIHSDLQKVKSAIQFVYNRQNETMNQIDSNFEELSSKIDEVKSKLSNLHNDTDSNFTKVKTELKKISPITKYKEQYQNFLNVVGKE